MVKATGRSWVAGPIATGAPVADSTTSAPPSFDSVCPVAMSAGSARKRSTIWLVVWPADGSTV